jgi:uncharacterized protein (TIGR02646 family)
MKYIIKKKGEPKSLTDKRNTPDSKYDGPLKDWQEQLLDEQGYLCAYCMGRISLDRDQMGNPHIGIEHYISQDNSAKEPYLGLRLDLQWQNMLGVCNGKFGFDLHCDKAKGKSKLNVLDPLDINKSEKVVRYSLSGEILPNTTNQDLERGISEDLNCILNLNAEKLKEARMDVMDVAKNILKKKYPNGAWRITDIDKEIRDWQSRTKDGRYKAYCQAAIWYLEQLKTRSLKRNLQ